jgi:hypothetical protein
MQLVRYRAVKNDMQKHQKTVSCLTVMGDHIWSGSADHSLIAWNIKTKAPVFELPQQVRLRRRRREREREREMDTTFHHVIIVRQNTAQNDDDIASMFHV